MRNIILNSVALAAAAALCVVAAIYSVQWIESRSERAVAHSLAESGEEWVESRADGLRVILSGTAPDEPARFRALSVAGSAVDAGRLVDAMQVEPVETVRVPDYRVEILRSGEDVSLIGLVPSIDDRDALREGVRRAAGTARIIDLLETAEGSAPATWDAVFAFGLEAIAALPRAKVSMTPERVAIVALVADADEKRQVEAALSRDAPAGVALSLDISAPRPVVAPFTVRFLIEDGVGRFDACVAATAAGRAAILRAAVDAGLDGAVTCTLGIGAPSPRWGEAVAMAIATLDGLGGGSLTFSDTEVTIVAPQGTDATTFDAEIGALETSLPPVFALHAVLPAPPETPEADDGAGPPQFTATRSPEGLVQLRGRLHDERARNVVEGFAQARFGAAETHVAVRVEEDVPAGWTRRVLAGLDALGYLAHGLVEVRPDSLNVNGETGDTDARAQIARLLADQLGGGQDFTVEAVYRADLDPNSGMPSPQECVRRIEGAVAEQKISFAPSSTEIDLASRKTLDRIAEILRECPPIEMEIAGYTDSQGRDEMNMRLSEDRAKAVLAELMGRRILTSGFQAVGYGESDPIGDNDTPEGREENRRIEFRLIGDAAGLGAEARHGPQ